jgi:hypothetical protein
MPGTKRVAGWTFILKILTALKIKVMLPSTETGHAKNVATFEDLISFCKGYGATYNPTKASIKLTALTEMLTTAQTALQAVAQAKVVHDDATNEREISFAPLKPRATKIINALAATDAKEQTVDDARTVINKIQGKRARAVEVPDEKALAAGAEPVKTSSTSQQSFDKQIDHLTHLITLLTNEPNYQPNEEELKVVTLNTMLADMKAKNTAVIDSWTTLSNARIQRNKTLYHKKTGLTDTAQAVKVYVKSIYGPKSPEFKQVSALKFTKSVTD